MGVTTRATQFQLSMMPIQKKLQLYSGGSHIFGQYGNPYDARIGTSWFPSCETPRARVRGLMYFFAEMMCCISSDTSFFHTRLPLFLSASGPTSGSEKMSSP